MNCLVPNCNNQAHSRGLCSAHYSQATYLIKQKKTTWEKLIKENKALSRSGSSKKDLEKSREFFLNSPKIERVQD